MTKEHKTDEHIVIDCFILLYLKFSYSIMVRNGFSYCSSDVIRGVLAFKTVGILPFSSKQSYNGSVESSCMSRDMEKLPFAYAKNKGLKKLWYMCLCFRYIYSTIPLLSKSKISKI